MFDIGFAELLLVGIVGLLVIGPERLPGAIRTTSAWVSRFRRSFDEVRAEVQRELHNDAVMRDLKESSDSIKRDLGQATADIKSDFVTMQEGLSEPLDSAKAMLDNDPHSDGVITAAKVSGSEGHADTDDADATIVQHHTNEANADKPS
tara:strand:- start:19 stop:465 length:447 start_codon:yes stop_codon:yes gene_type:complete